MAESLRDTIANAYDTVTAKETPQPEGVVDSTIPGDTPQPAPVETTPEKPGRTAGRARDEKGKLLPGPAVKAEPVVATEPAKPRPQRPSSWKKEYWDHWEKLDPQLAEYINQRESDYAKGVSTYKTEWDQVKPIAEAMAQFTPLLQQANIKPEQWITNLGNAHKMLATGTPENKASAFLKLAQDYQVPLETLFVQGQDGKLYYNPQVQPYQAPAPQVDVRQTVKEMLLEQQVTQELQNFVNATDDNGNKKHPHFEAVKPTMLGLLQAGLATDHEDAYKQALALPRHADLTAADRAQAEKAELERKVKEKAEAVARARSQAISPKGSTPAVTGEQKPKGIRASIEDAFEKVVGGGRV